MNCTEQAQGRALGKERAPAACGPQLGSRRSPRMPALRALRLPLASVPLSWNKCDCVLQGCSRSTFRHPQTQSFVAFEPYVTLLPRKLQPYQGPILTTSLHGTSLEYAGCMSRGPPC